jgi:hypothetical protein
MTYAFLNDLKTMDFIVNPRGRQPVGIVGDVRYWMAPDTSPPWFRRSARHDFTVFDAMIEVARGYEG